MTDGHESKAIVAANIRRLMRKRGYTATDVCKALDIPNATFSDWINAKTYPRIDKIEKMAAFFEVGKASITELSIDRDDPLMELSRSNTEEGRLLYLWHKADAIDKQTIWNILSRYDEDATKEQNSAV